MLMMIDVDIENRWRLLWRRCWRVSLVGLSPHRKWKEEQQWRRRRRLCIR
jgi:hypothetical protein